MKAKSIVKNLLKTAGIQLNGSEPWDIQIHNPKFYRRVLAEGSLGLGESYMDKWWDCQSLDQFFAKITRVHLSHQVRNIRLLFPLLVNYVFNRQVKRRAFQVGEKHYDLGNDFFELMLDPYMNYSCGYWRQANDLNRAQINKMELICQKLKLQPGMRVLDVGCGWGGLANYMASHYDVEVVGVTVSKQQAEFARKRCANLPVTILFQDYRELNEKFDAAVSVGMFEHVGYKNYATYMRVVHRCLKDNALFLLHTIGANYTHLGTDRWMTKYIFPNGMLPSIKQIGASIENLFVMEDWHNFGDDYAKTLMSWHENFMANWDKVKANYSERFYRMWNYYLLACAGAFRARDIVLWQIVLAKGGVLGGYESVR